MEELGVGAEQHGVKYLCNNALAQTGVKYSSEADESTLARKAAK